MTSFFELANVAKETIFRDGGQPVMLYMNLGGMKYFNRKHGFAEGDRLLQSFARLLSGIFGSGGCCRLSQDHFGAFSKEEGLEDKLTRLIRECSELNDGNSLLLRIGIYTALFEHMLDHDLIDVYLGIDARDFLTIQNGATYVNGAPIAGEVIYTGQLDELFGMDMGALPYRTLDMQFETLDQDQFQPVGTVNYTTSEDFTRITEFKNMTGQVVPGKTTIMREYSKAWDPTSGETPYYAILEDESQALYARYRERVEGIVNFHLVGRLAEYRYYDMDGVVASALELSDEIIAQH